MVRGLIDLLILPLIYLMARETAKSWFEKKYFHSKTEDALNRVIDRLEKLEKEETTNDFKG